MLQYSRDTLKFTEKKFFTTKSCELCLRADCIFTCDFIFLYRHRIYEHINQILYYFSEALRDPIWNFAQDAVKFMMALDFGAICDRDLPSRRLDKRLNRKVTIARPLHINRCITIFPRRVSLTWSDWIFFVLTLSRQTDCPILINSRKPDEIL